MRRSVAIRLADGTWWTPPLAGEPSFTLNENGCETAQIPVTDSRWTEEVLPESPVRISHTGSGRILWTGSTILPGSQFEGARSTPGVIGCVGNLTDLTRPAYRAPYLVTRPDAWGRSWHVVTSKSTIATEQKDIPIFPGILAGQVITFPEAMTYTNNQGAMSLLSFEDAPGFYIGALGGRIDSGLASADHKTQLKVGPSSPLLIDRANTAGTAYNFSLFPTGVGTSFPPGQTELDFIYKYVGAPGVATEDTWTSLSAWRVVAQFRLRDGTVRTLVTSLSITADMVVEDMLWRWLPNSDKPASVVTAGAVIIPALDYTDPTSPAQILDDLCDIETDWRWSWSPANDSDLCTLTVGPWPTAARYLVPDHPDVAVTEPGGESSLADRVRVEWTYEKSGRTTSRTFVSDRAQYPDLQALPASGVWAPTIVLEGALRDFPDTWAEPIARRVLGEVGRIPDAATVECGPGARILDMDTGDACDPDEVRPGHVVHVQALGRAARCTGVSAEGGAATLTLGRPPRTAEQWIRSVQQRRRRTR